MIFGTLFSLITYLWTWDTIVEFDKVAFIVDIFFLDLLTIVAAAQFLLLRHRLEGAQLTNHILHLDNQLEGNLVSAMK